MTRSSLIFFDSVAVRGLAKAFNVSILTVLTVICVRRVVW